MNLLQLLPQWLETHGYWLLALGCLLEGETVLILAGFAAHRGRLDPLAVVAVAAVAGFTGDQIAFWAGRWRGAALLVRWPAIGGQRERLNRLLLRWDAALVIGVRFAYGLRLAGPVLMGMSPMSGWRFAGFNALGALLWAVLVGGVGWVFGEAAQALLDNVQRVEGVLLLVLATAALAWWWLQRRRARRTAGRR